MELSYISQNGNPTSYISGRDFPSSKHLKNPPREKLLILQETEGPKKFLIFSQGKLFLYFRKRKPQKMKKATLEMFLIFQENGSF